MGIFILFEIVIVGLFVYVLYRKRVNGICKSKKRLDGKTCLVTGGTSGIGLEMAIDFASRGARVIVACPFEEEGKNAEKRIINESGNNNVVFKFMDLASLRSVRNFAADILKTEERLNILMNNAGIASSTRKETEDAICVTMQVNYLGHFLLTLLLLPLLIKSGTPTGPSRIVNTTSIMTKIARVDADKLAINENGVYGVFVTYANSKMNLELFSHELKKRLISSNVVINNADPGEVGTGIFLGGSHAYLFPFFIFCACFAKTLYEGAQTGLHLALDEKAGLASGQVYRDCKPIQTAYVDDGLARRVWDKSLELVNLTESNIKLS